MRGRGSYERPRAAHRRASFAQRHVLTHDFGASIQTLNRILGAISIGARCRNRSDRCLARSRRALSTGGQFFSCRRWFESGMERAIRASPNAEMSSAVGRQRCTRSNPLHLIPAAQGKCTASDRKCGRSGESRFPHGHLQWCFLESPNRGATPCLIKLKFGQRVTAAQCWLRMFILAGAVTSFQANAAARATSRGYRLPIQGKSAA